MGLSLAKTWAHHGPIIGPSLAQTWARVGPKHGPVMGPSWAHVVASEQLQVRIYIYICIYTHICIQIRSLFPDCSSIRVCSRRCWRFARRLGCILDDFRQRVLQGVGPSRSRACKRRTALASAPIAGVLVQSHVRMMLRCVSSSDRAVKAPRRVGFVAVPRLACVGYGAVYPLGSLSRIPSRLDMV
jgi:hypothetical protein